MRPVARAVVCLCALAIGATGLGAAPEGDEPARSVDLICPIQGTTTLIFLAPDGSRVKKGELVCELDSAALKDQLTNQKITAQQAEAAQKNAGLVVEVARLALEEAEELAQQEPEQTKGEIKLAEAEIALARIMIEQLERANADRPSSDNKAVLARARIDLARAELKLSQAQFKLKRLTRYTNSRRAQQARSDYEQAKADERARAATLALEKAKAEKLERSIGRCKLYAPCDGVVVHARGPGAAKVEEGSTVRERQFILRIVAPGADRG